MGSGTVDSFSENQQNPTIAKCMFAVRVEVNGAMTQRRGQVILISALTAGQRWKGGELNGLQMPLPQVPQSILCCRFKRMGI